MTNNYIHFNKIVTIFLLGSLIIANCLFANPSHAQVIKSFQKISSTQGGLSEAGGDLMKGDDFGESLDNIGDLDGDGIIDLVVGAMRDDDGGENRGAVRILFMNTDGTVRDVQIISSTQGGFTGVLDDEDRFGVGATGLGDIDGDGVLDIAVGADRDDDTGPFGGGNSNNGAVYILFLNTDGTVKSHQKISETQGGLNRNVFRFGTDLEMLGDLDNDGIGDLFVSMSGGFRILYLNSDGTVKTVGNLISGSNLFGWTGALLEDLDGDGVMEIATGSQFENNRRGSVSILFMNADGTVKSQQKIGENQGGFTGQLEDGDEFGQSVSPIGDHNNDGIPDLLVGAEHADAPECTSGVNNECSNKDTGEVWILHLNTNGTVKSHELIRSDSENFTTIRKNANLGQAVTYLGDLNGDGIGDIAASADGDRDPLNGSGVNRGSVYVMFLEGEGGNLAPVLAPISNQVVTEGDTLILPISATDDDGPAPLILEAMGAPAGASFMDNGNGNGTFTWTTSIGDSTNSPYNVTFIATDDDGDGLSDSQGVTITVNPVGGGTGSLSGSASNITGNVNLTTTGTDDWTHWKGGTNPLSRKAGITPLISDFTLIGSETPVGAGTKATYIWNDGTPVVSDSTKTGIRVFNVGNGFRVTMPADTTARTLNLYVGAKNARGQLTATLSDNSATAFTTLINQPSGLGTHVVTLNYVAASAGQTLTIDFTMEMRFNSTLKKSQINLEGATLF